MINNFNLLLKNYFKNVNLPLEQQFVELDNLHNQNQIYPYSLQIN